MHFYWFMRKRPLIWKATGLLKVFILLVWDKTFQKIMNQDAWPARHNKLNLLVVNVSLILSTIKKCLREFLFHYKNLERYQIIKKNLFGVPSRKFKKILLNNCIKLKPLSAIAMVVWEVKHFTLVRLADIWDKYKRSAFYLHTKRVIYSFRLD